MTEGTHHRRSSVYLADEICSISGCLPGTAAGKSPKTTEAKLRNLGIAMEVLPCCTARREGKNYGGEGGIRTPDTLSGMAAFEAARFNRSRTSPRQKQVTHLPGSRVHSLPF